MQEHTIQKGSALLNVSFSELAVALASDYESIFLIDTENDNYVEYRMDSNRQTLTIGMQKIGGDFYLFSKRGTLQTGKFYTENDKTYYFGKDGKRITGWMTKWSSTYYFDEEGVMQTGFTDIEGYTYYFKADGRFVHTAWITIGDKKYYAKADGKLAKAETITKWGKKYSFDADGVLIP